FIPFLPIDQCRCWQSGWQDFGITARYNLINLNRTFMVTPSASLGEPSHDYAFQGEAVLGRHLKELRLAVDAGYRVDSISPKLSVTGRYSYAIVEQVLDIPNNRSNVDFEGAFAVTRKFSARALTAWQHTHGGLRGGPVPGVPPPSPPSPFRGDINTQE